MRRPPCPRSWELRAIDEGRLAASDAAAFERHARVCASCLRQANAAAELRALSAELAASHAMCPTELEMRRQRARLLRDAMSASSSDRGRVVVAALAVAVVAVVVWARSGHRAVPPSSFAAVLTPAPVADFARTRVGSDERVVLRDGDLGFQVRKQVQGERFVVMLPDGELEVRGTTFDVSVHDGRTERVHVDTGVVVVRVHGESVLSEGDSWSPPLAPPASSPPEARPSALLRAPLPASPSTVMTPAPPLRTSPSDRPAKAAPRAADGAPLARPAEAPEREREMPEYERAVDAYRLGRFEQSAELLHSFLTSHPSSPLAEDASFIEAASQASAGHAQLAGRLAEEHARRFPDSFHQKEAAILVARARRDLGDCDGARRVVARWLGTARPEASIVSALGPCGGRP